jgi:uncharacterized DUF497 family protein
MAMQFEWDEEKAEINFRKHRIGFDEAKTVFGDRSPLPLTTRTIPKMSNGLLTSVNLPVEDF